MMPRRLVPVGVSGRRRSYAFPFLDDDVFSCDPTPVEPAEPLLLVAPKVTPAVCTAEGAITQPVIDLVKTEGVTFSIEGDVKAGKTVTVTAKVTGDRLLAAANGWITSGDRTSAQLTFTLADVICERPTEPEDTDEPENPGGNPTGPGEPGEPGDPADPSVPGEPQAPGTPADEPKTAEGGLAATGAQLSTWGFGVALALVVLGAVAIALPRKIHRS